MLPKDEYQRKKVVFFLAESGIFLLFSMIILVIVNWNNVLGITIEASIVLFFGIYSIYYFVRYMFSGIEYTNVATEKEFKREKRKVMIESIILVVGLLLIQLLTERLPSNFTDWVYLLTSYLVIAILLYLIKYVSLKRSYKKNKELI